MTNWAELTGELEHLLRLRTYPVAYKRLEKLEELEKVPKVRRLDRTFHFCQLITLARRGGWTVGVTKDDLIQKCARINGLSPTTEEIIAENAARLGNLWFSNVEEATKQLRALPLVPPGEAVVLAPLASEKFDPDVILIFGSPAQLVLLMNGLQFKDYERFQFFFVGESACADSLAQCYISGKPAFAIPCFGERRYGGVEEDEVVLALPSGMLGKAIDGVKSLWERGFRYPIASPVQPDVMPQAAPKA